MRGPNSVRRQPRQVYQHAFPSSVLLHPGSMREHSRQSVDADSSLSSVRHDSARHAGRSTARPSAGSSDAPGYLSTSRDLRSAPGGNVSRSRSRASFAESSFGGALNPGP